MCIHTNNSDHIVVFIKGVVKNQRALGVSTVHELPIWGEDQAHHFTSVLSAISCILLVTHSTQKQGIHTFFGYIPVFSQKFGTGYVKDSDNTRVEATGEYWVAGMESHTARAVHRHKVIQLLTGDNRMQHYC